MQKYGGCIFNHICNHICNFEKISWKLYLVGSGLQSRKINIPAGPKIISTLQPKKQLKQQTKNQLKSNQLKVSHTPSDQLWNQIWWIYSTTWNGSTSTSSLRHSRRRHMLILSAGWLYNRCHSSPVMKLRSRLSADSFAFFKTATSVSYDIISVSFVLIV